MKAIIFGINGQDGYYLEKLCKEKDIDVIGISKDKTDITDFGSIRNLIKDHQPPYIFHLAAVSTTNHKALFKNHDAISTGTINILEAVYRYSRHTKVFITGSGVQFKNEHLPISESSEFEANNPYSVARIHSVYAARYYRSLGLKTYIGYLFHHESPMRSSKHISKIIVDAVKRIAAGSDEILEIGDLTVQKEWTFAGDIVEGIFTLVNQDSIFEAVIGSGETYTIEDWLKTCFSLKGLDWEKHVRVRKNYKSEYQLLASEPSLIQSLGWKPKTGFFQLAQMMLDHE